MPAADPVSNAKRRRPRLLFFNPGIYALGGMQAWLAELMPGLEAEGFEVYLAVADGRFQEAEGYLRAFPWGRSVRVRNWTGTHLGARRAVHQLLARLRPDLLVVAHLASVLEAVAERRAQARESPKVVVSFHAIDDGFFRDVERFRGAIDALALPNRLLVEGARRRGGIDSDRIYHGPYALEVPPWPGDQPLGRDTALKIVFPHRLEATQKRILDLPVIAQELERLGVASELAIVGSGPDEAALRSSLDQLQLEKVRIHWRGPLPPQVLLEEVLIPSQTLLVTSAWENGPMVLLQAMARGVPVVSSRYLSSRAEGLLRHRETAWLFEVGDTRAAAQALLESRQEPLRSLVRKRAWEVVSERFERGRVARRWAEILREVLALPPTSALVRVPELPAPRGRLDRWFGVRGAELVRLWLKRTALVSGPGDEWPHTQGGALAPEALFRWFVELENGLSTRIEED